MPTDAPQQLIAKWRAGIPGHDLRGSDDIMAEECADELAHLRETVLLLAIEALDDAQEYICDQTGSPYTHESLMAKINAARKAWDAPAGGEGTAK